MENQTERAAELTGLLADTELEIAENQQRIVELQAEAARYQNEMAALG